MTMTKYDVYPPLYHHYPHHHRRCFFFFFFIFFFYDDRVPCGGACVCVCGGDSFLIRLWALIFRFPRLISEIVSLHCHIPDIHYYRRSFVNKHNLKTNIVKDKMAGQTWRVDEGFIEKLSDDFVLFSRRERERERERDRETDRDRDREREL